MGFDHRAYGGFVFHPDRRTGTNHEEIPPNPTALKSTPKLKPVCGLAFVEAAHGLGVEGESLVWHHHPTTHETRHVEKKIRTVRVHLLKRPTNIPGHAVNIVIKQDLEVFPYIIDLREGFVPEVLQQALRLIDVAILYRTHGDRDIMQQTRCGR